MKKDEVIEIARMAAPFLGEPDADMVVVLEAFANEVERRTLERCLEAISPNGTPMEIAAAIRALKEEV